MKEAEQYLIYDGLLNVSEDISMDTSVPSSASIVEEDNVTISEGSSQIEELFSEVEELSTTPQDSPVSAKKHELQRLVVHQCTEESISPNKLAAMHGISPNTVRNWVKKSDAQLPLQYKESNSINEQPVASTSNTVALKHSKELITNLKSKWPSLLLAETNVVVSLKCSKCSFETSKKRSLDLHEKSIHVECAQCGQIFIGARAQSQLAGHLKKHQDQFPKQYLCDFCNKDCKFKQNVKRHMKTCPEKPS